MGDCLRRGARVARVILFVALFAAVVFAAEFRFDTLPDGFAPGRQDASYGVYRSSLQPEARPYQQMLDALERKIYGLVYLSHLGETWQAETIYYLEELVISTHRLIADSDPKLIPSFERQTLLSWSVRLYRQLRTHSERLYEAMIRHIDVALPGTSGPQVPQPTDGGNLVHYRSNGRSEKLLNDKELKELYEKKLAEFLRHGGTLSEMQILSSQLAKEMSALTQLEYVERRDGSVWVTTGKAGHLLLAGGEPVLAAGQIVIVKDSVGQILMLVVSNASGNFKPDLLSAEILANDLAEAHQIGFSRVVVTKGEPLSTQTTKILMRAQGQGDSASERFDHVTIDTKLREINAIATEIRQDPRKFLTPALQTTPHCARALVALGPVQK